MIVRQQTSVWRICRKRYAFIQTCFALFCMTAFSGLQCSAESPRWSEQHANDWYGSQPWFVGANYVPSDAINQLEMWQSDTFNPNEIDREFGWAESLGMNTMRVFLHDLLWQQDPSGFKRRLDKFLAIAAKHHIRPIFVLFDSCWDPKPQLGPQHPPIPGVHNSGWVQAPGANGLANAGESPRLQGYVVGVVGAFANDRRVLAWDIWNEPDNPGGGNYDAKEPPDKVDLVDRLLPLAFEWARSANPTQPLTSGIWTGDWASPQTLSKTARIQIEESDIISFHDYGWPEAFLSHVHELRQYNRPLFCTEFMARGAGSTFDGTLPLAEKERVAAVNWGLVAGKSQTYLPWDSWKRPYVDLQPTVWFHDVFHPDGSLYRPSEGDLIRTLVQQSAAPHQ